MSFLYIRKFADSVHMLTDGCAWNERGEVVGIASKVITAEGLPLAITLTGNAQGAQFLTEAFQFLCAGETVDQSMQRLTKVVASLQVYKERLGTLNIYAIGVSEASGPFAKVACTEPQGNEPAFVFVDRKQHMNTTFFEGSFDLDIPPFDATPENFGAFAVPFAENQRSFKAVGTARPELGPIHWIGGFLEHTVVSKGGHSQAVLHRWPDRVGEQILGGA